QRDELGKQVKELEKKLGQAERKGQELMNSLLPGAGRFWLNAYSDHLDQDLAVYLEDDAMKDGKHLTPRFDPGIHQGGDLVRTVAIGMSFQSSPGTRYKLYYSQYGLRDRKPENLSYAITGYVFGGDFVLPLPKVHVTTERPWVFVGTFVTDATG